MMHPERRRENLKKIEEMDMVEVVRCKDCKFWYKDECSHLCKITGDLHPAKWFCADGEKKSLMDTEEVKTE